MAKLLHLATPHEKTGNDFGVEIPEEINTDLRDIILTEEMLAKGNRLMDMNLPKGTLQQPYYHAISSIGLLHILQLPMNQQ